MKNVFKYFLLVALLLVTSKIYAQAPVTYVQQGGPVTTNIPSGQCVHTGANGLLTGTGSDCGSGGGGTGTANGLSVAQTLNPAFGTNTSGSAGGGTALFMLGDSTYANYLNTLGDLENQSNAPGQPLYGMHFDNLNNAYTCSGGSYVFTVPNSSGVYRVGTYFGSGNNTSPTGSLTQSGANNYWLVSAATSTTITAAQQISPVTCSSGGNTGSGMVISPNVIIAGYSGATVEFLTSTALTNLITAMQAQKAAGYNPVLTLREGINDVRISKEPLSTLVTAVNTQISTVLAASGLANTPVIFVGENSINSVTGGTQYIFPNGTASSQNTNPALVPSSLTASTPATVTLTNPTGQTFCPTDMWAGPGMPIVTSSQGNTFTALLDTVGSGVQETVTVTALSVTASGGGSTSSCTVTFTPANNHASNAPFVSTNAWAAQSATDQLWMLANSVQQLSFPTLLVLPTQGYLSNRNAATTVFPPGMSDQLHLTGSQRIAEDNALARMVASVVNLPDKILWRPPVVSAPINTTAGWQLPEITANTTKLDSSFSQYAASQTITSAPNGANYWHPWSTGQPAYQFGCEDSNLFDTILATTVRNPYASGASVLALNAITGAQTDILGGAIASDEIAIPGYGCFSGQISSASPGTFQIQITLANANLLPSLSVGTPVFIQRYRSYASAGMQYVNWPTSYPWHRKVLFTGGSITAASPTAGNAGSGFVTNDTITMKCQTTNFVGTVTASAGAVTAIAVTTAGSGCGTVFGIAPISTSGAGTGLLVNLTANQNSFVVNKTNGYWTPVGSSIKSGYIICGGNEVGCTTLPASNFSCAPQNPAANLLTSCTDSNSVIGTTYVPYFGVPVDIFAAVAPDVEATNAQVGTLFIHDPAYPASSTNGQGVKVVFAGGGSPTVTFPNTTGTTALIGAAISQTFNGPVIVGQTAFTVSGCGTAGAVTGNGTVGSFTVGTGATNCTFTVTLNGASGMTAAHGWVANADDTTANIHCVNSTTVSTTTVVFVCTGTIATSDLIKFSASPY